MEEFKEEFTIEKVTKSIRKILDENENFSLNDLTKQFSRKADSFFPLLSIEINGANENYGNLFNKAQRLFYFVNKYRENMIDNLYSCRNEEDINGEILANQSLSSLIEKGIIVGIIVITLLLTNVH